MTRDKNPNIALVVLDTLRKDSFDRFFGWIEGTHYENAWSTSHGTVPAHGSLFTGYYSSEVGMTTDKRTLNCSVPVLPELLSDSGYRTRGFSCNTNITPFFNYDRGFEEFEGPSQIPGFDRDVLDWKRFIERSRGDGPSRYAKAVYECITGDCKTLPSLKAGIDLKLQYHGVDSHIEDKGGREALEWVSETQFNQDSEFVFMNLMEAHGPYEPPEEFRTTEHIGTEGVETCLEGWGDKTGTAKQAYNDSVRYLSNIYEKIYSQLAKDFDIIVTVADHGESFGEYDTFQHLIGVPPELTHIPIVISTPSKDGLKPTDMAVSLIDVFQTVLSEAGIQSPSQTRGESLSDIRESDLNRSRLTEYHGLSSRPKESLRRLGYSEEKITDLDTACSGVVTRSGYSFESPIESEVLTIGSPKADALSEIEQLRSTLQDISKNGDESVSSEVEEHLEDLGYA